MKTRLDGYVVACSAAAAAAVGGVAQNAEAAIVYSGVVNINIPTSTAGVYLNVVTGANGTAASTPGWDVNPWSSTTLSFFNPSAPAGGVYVRMDAAVSGVSNLPANTMIDGASLYTSGTAQTTGSYPFNLSSSNNLVGFRFTNEANSQVHYGWMRIALDATLNGQPRSIVEYAYEDQPGVGIPAGAIPTPGTAALLAVGAAGLAGRRRRA